LSFTVNMMNCPKRCLLSVFLTIAMPILSGLLSPAFAQNAGAELPLVVAGKMPLYPIMARAARVQGVVKIKVTTNGKKVTSVDVESGPPMLVKFAEENVLSWEFTEHKPTTFVTTFEYVIEETAECEYTNGASVLKLPLEIHISAKGLETCDPAVKKNPHP